MPANEVPGRERVPGHASLSAGKLGMSSDTRHRQGPCDASEEDTDDVLPYLPPVEDLMSAGGVGNPEVEEKAVDTAWRVHAAVGEWTARVDAKASFALTLESAAGAVIIALSGNGNIFAGPHGWVIRCLLWSGCVSILVAAVLAALVVAPRLRASALRTEAPDNFVYFGHLMHREAEELAESLRRAQPLPVLSRQLVVMSRIAWTKHRQLQLSFVSFAFGLALVVLAAVSA